MSRKTMVFAVAVLCLVGGGLLLKSWSQQPPPRFREAAGTARPQQVKAELPAPERAAVDKPAGKKDVVPAIEKLAERKVAPPASQAHETRAPKVAKSAPAVYAETRAAPVDPGSGLLDSRTPAVGKLQTLGGLGALGVGDVGTKGGGGAVAMGVGSASMVGRGGSAGLAASASYGSLRSYGSGAGYGGVASYGSVGYGSGAASSRRAGVVSSPEEPSYNTEGYHNYGVNPWTSTARDRLSTFAVDVDTASYTIARRKLLEGTLPPKDSVRVEEFLNYFHYSYPAPVMAPLAVSMDAAPSPFNAGRHILRVGVQGKRLSLAERKPAHLTFLVDVSGSMQSPDKLPLIKRALRLLVDTLRDSDTVAIVTYASGVRLVLPPTGLEGRERIMAAIEDLQAGGSTDMASGFDLAYKQAMRTLDGSSVSRVLILSDGDANVGPTSHQEILQQIRGYVKEGITLSTFGFGMGNYKDEMMEQLADRGNGNYFYIDSLMQARRVFQEQLGGTLEVIAQDVKLQVEFDPAQVRRYRLVGYENRAIADEDFRNDRVDAGEIGAGHSVTALYELELAPGAGQGLATVRIRAKPPRGVQAAESAFDFPASALARSFEDAPADLRFATAVMGAAEIFRQSPQAAGWSYDQVVKIARGAAPAGNAERAEFVALLERARAIVGRVATR